MTRLTAARRGCSFRIRGGMSRLAAGGGPRAAAPLLINVRTGVFGSVVVNLCAVESGQPHSVATMYLHVNYIYMIYATPRVARQPRTANVRRRRKPQTANHMFAMYGVSDLRIALPCSIHAELIGLPS